MREAGEASAVRGGPNGERPPTTSAELDHVAVPASGFRIVWNPLSASVPLALGVAVREASLSVVMPVHDEAAHLPETIEGLVAAVEGSGFAAELVLVDDGSQDGSAEVARATVDGRIPLRVLAQANRGRLAARRAGLEAATGDFVLFLDARVRLTAGALRFVRERVDDGEPVWNGHVRVEGESAFAIFWRLLAELAWRD